MEKIRRYRTIKERTLFDILLRAFVALCFFAAGLFFLWQGDAVGGDFKVCNLDITEGVRTNEVVQRDGRHVILPMGITLNKLIVEEEDPSIALYNTTKWTLVEEYKPRIHKGSVEIVGQYQISVDTVILHAVPMANGGYTSQNKPGAVPAAYVHVTNTAKQTQFEGWIFTGYASVLPQNVSLEGNEVLSLLYPEVKSFSAYITVHRSNGTSKTITLQSLTPKRDRRYKFCLASFDAERGKWADTCRIEIEKLPSLCIIFAGFVLLIFGIRDFVKALRFLRERKLKRQMPYKNQPLT